MITFFAGFTVNIGHASIFIVELWGMRKGLRFGIIRAVAEMDSLIAVRFVNEEREPDNLAASLLSDIRNLITELESCILQHTLREGNAVVDFLAALGHSSPPGLCILDSPPNGLRSILLGDKMGVTFLRTWSFCFFSVLVLLYQNTMALQLSNAPLNLIV
ncbi:hypothetical protein SLEP1_g9776 [Rubroshorea leprosula]|uniref:RNase H type-1 domain-containing protein n=1 Tax=Rubroshorea leprosula TaxID=152421 RepID=A0AAV5IBX4_9ROSI|nr:hypothetical protein SLEP1_g9776 [Rubroshorea leprosula]